MYTLDLYLKYQGSHRKMPAFVLLRARYSLLHRIGRAPIYP